MDLFGINSSSREQFLRKRKSRARVLRCFEMVKDVIPVSHGNAGKDIHEVA